MAFGEAVVGFAALGAAGAAFRVGVALADGAAIEGAAAEGAGGNRIDPGLGASRIGAPGTGTAGAGVLAGAAGCWAACLRARAAGSKPSIFSRSTTASPRWARPMMRVSARHSTKNTPARILVVRVRRSPTPRVDIKPEGPPPMPSAPPSERWSRITPTNAAQTKIRITSRTACSTAECLLDRRAAPETGARPYQTRRSRAIAQTSPITPWLARSSSSA